MRKKHRVFIPLVGGLGNQLFILNYGNFLNTKYDVEIILTNDWLHDRKSEEFTRFLVNAFGLKINNEIKITVIERKIINAFFRSLSLSNTEGTFAHLLAITIKVFGNPLYKLFVSRKSQIYSFEPDIHNLIPTLKRDTTLVGYFQNNLIADKTKTNKALDSIWAKFPEEERLALNRLITKYSSKECILIHHRLGDYKQDKLFTKLPESYFIEAIRKQENDGQQFNKLVLTNDVLESRNMLKSILSLKYLDDEVQFSNLAWIIFGREFENYVLSNSTFGWWMAFLSEKAKYVVYPDPWFKKFHYDMQMAPEEWYRFSLEPRD